jgi:hypothetical protein
MTTRPAATRVTLSTRSTGIHFGTVGQVRRRGRIIHTTAPRPYGCRAAAKDDARGWAIEHGYIHIADHEPGVTD